MKYFLLSFLFLGLTSCSLSDPLNKNSTGNTIPNINVGGVQVSDSGVSVASEDGNVSVGMNDAVTVGDSSGGVSVGEDGMNVRSGEDAVKVGKDGISVGTGIKIPGNNMEDIEKDPEIESISKDLDNIFSDIEKGGK